ncbi:hypothetical protein LJB99_02510 [Deltaproteobacteria bacterium OttesenSCG-928-K17]|nr:hypothetical protein [Deltaproteobacteria bacterium OttesenSCG-928-K17]
MAEFCLECLNRIHGTDFKETEVTLQVDLCEGCGEIKPCVVSLGRAGTDMFRRFVALILKTFGKA